MDDVSDEVLQVAHQYLRRVSKSGPDDVMALCPFHRKDGREERTPSFAMSLSKGLFFCHSCQAKGNLRTFFKLLELSPEDIAYKYAVLLDAVDKNIPPPPDPTKPKAFELEPLEERILGLFDYCPTALLDAGFAMTTLKHFEVGYDSWHQRITYPIRDLPGKLVAISGRTVVGALPRFKIYDKEYPTWGVPAQKSLNKSAILYNADKVYPETYFSRPDQTYVVVVEGFKACMAVWQAGIRNVVALLGNWVSDDHLWIFERMGAPITLFLDNNFAGQNGTYNGGAKLAKSMQVNVASYPHRLRGHKDAQPDSCTPNEIIEAIQGASSYYCWRLTCTVKTQTL